MVLHTIRLLGPWDFEWLAPTPPRTGAATGSVRMPCDWLSLFGDSAGPCRFSRCFHKPTNLDPHEQVWLVATGVGGTGFARLNTLPLGAVAPFSEWEITAMLQKFNRVDFDIEFSPGASTGPGGLFAPVVFEIRDGRVATVETTAP